MTDERIDEFLNAVSRIAQEWDGEIYGLPRHNLPRVEMRAQTRTLLDAALRSSTRKSADEGQVPKMLGEDAIKAAVLDSIDWSCAGEMERIRLHEWAVSRWRAEVENRPLVNVHRRTLDDTWRQVIRFAGGDPDEAIGPSHDALLAAQPKEADHGH